MQARCSCGAFVRPCNNCGAIPHVDDGATLMDYRPTPDRIARIERRTAELFAARTRQAAIDRFIRECANATLHVPDGSAKRGQEVT